MNQPDITLYSTDEGLIIGSSRTATISWPAPPEEICKCLRPFPSFCTNQLCPSLYQALYLLRLACWLCANPSSRFTTPPPLFHTNCRHSSSFVTVSAPSSNFSFPIHSYAVTCTSSRLQCPAHDAFAFCQVTFIFCNDAYRSFCCG